MLEAVLYGVLSVNVVDWRPVRPHISPLERSAWQRVCRSRLWTWRVDGRRRLRGMSVATCIVMKRSRRRVDVPVQLDRRRADEDVFEHVIWGVRLNHILQMLRDVDVLEGEPQYPESSSAHPIKRPH